MWDIMFFVESRMLTLHSRAYNTIAGFSNSVASNLLLGVGRVDSDDDDYEDAQLAGDIVSTVIGGAEMIGGTNGNIVGGILDVTGAGAAAGVLINGASTAVTAHGGAVTAVSSWHAMSGIKQRKEGKHGTFRGRESKRANDADFKRVARELGLSKDQQQRLHREIGGGDLSYKEIRAVAEAMFRR
jgi:hypothetical protein